MRRFHDALRSLRKISGKDFETVIKHELGAVLTQTIRSMKKATAGSIEKNHREQPGAFYDIEYAGPVSRTGKQYTASEIARARQRAAKARSRGKNGRALYYLAGSSKPKRYPDWLWRQIKHIREQALPRKKMARGLAARMWVHIADQLRIPVQAPGYVRNAQHYKKGNMAGAVMVQERSSGKSYGLGFINALTKTNRFAGHAAKGKTPSSVGNTFRIQLNKRANYLSQSVKLKAKGAIESVLARYPRLGSVS